MTKVLWNQVEQGIMRLVDIVKAQSRVKYMYGIPRGGAVVAGMLSQRLAPHVTLLNGPIDDSFAESCVIVDDIYDSGRTLAPWLRKNFLCAVLVTKQQAGVAGVEYGSRLPENEWVEFPWEANETGPHDAVRRLIQFVGENPDSDALKDTPRRVCDSLKERVAGRSADMGALFKSQFEAPTDEMVVLRGIDFVSTCEHHLMPFVGQAWVGYIPGQGTAGKYRVVGLSKLARVVDVFALRLQLQERMTSEIAEAIFNGVGARGVGVIVRAKHLCMTTRGAKKQNADMVTSCLLGMFRTDHAARAEFLSMVQA
jgi:GTP cyclohydrolase I